MVAGIDIGNTTAVITFLEEGQAGLEKKIQLRRNFDITQWAGEIKKAEEVVISSVVPSLSEQIMDFCNRNKKKGYVISKKNVSLVDFSNYSSEIGADRICTSVGAAFAYQVPVCVVDMGTATTFSVVDKDFVYRGGLIMPGITTLFKSLSSFTSQLPELQMKEVPVNFLGLNTKENIVNGVYYLALEGIKGILAKIKKETPEIKIIGTGGWANIFNKIYDFLDENLIFKGISAIYFKEIKKDGKSANFSL